MVTIKSFFQKYILWIVILVFGYNCQTKKLDHEAAAIAITNEAKTNLVQKLNLALREGGTKQAIPFCKLNAIGFTNRLGQKHEVTLRRITNKPRNHSNLLSVEEEKIFLEIEKLKTSEGVFPNKTVTSDESVTVYVPIPVMGFCLQCHGNSNEIQKETKQILNREYPNDKAIGYQVGELRGLFSVKFTK
ncbi:DUF3365 domain-containing protein [Leptospira congkakensis]|uniref:DUF3365 domain-containing protein n=1 Tax=Leptospira congkakensis TaxID=2484932 RepID=A0A4Z1A6W2_9LEPT|nr:DUF3365 domain-containing protein [Leptospira congkakensis]TGL90738.1 DUF3365 domain-containing protein [Leptospira congkakensis]TGL91745.1 DUF3365 domain-containing protein [Leptospira congkakensis]TGL98799.1 DUF3365 domain-containing protein [Leptospira congkakensis]